jgi:metal-dependent amidase/aminoacylase/carboxypeptidase family protein
MIGYPSLINNEEITREATQFAQEILDEDNVVQLDLRMTAEDFAYFSQEIPSTFYRLGVTDKAGKLTSPLHSPTFNVDEKALETGMKTMAYAAIRFLNKD